MRGRYDPPCVGAEGKEKQMHRASRIGGASRRGCGRFSFAWLSRGLLSLTCFFMAARPARAATLSGSFAFYNQGTAGPMNNIDLTALGTTDWVKWGHSGVTVGVTPPIRKNGGTAFANFSSPTPSKIFNDVFAF